MDSLASGLLGAIIGAVIGAAAVLEAQRRERVHQRRMSCRVVFLELSRNMAVLANQGVGITLLSTAVWDANMPAVASALSIRDATTVGAAYLVLDALKSSSARGALAPSVGAVMEALVPAIAVLRKQVPDAPQAEGGNPAIPS